MVTKKTKPRPKKIITFEARNLAHCTKGVAEAFGAMTRDSLTNSGHYIADDLTRAFAFTMEDWRERLKGSEEHAYFGLFAGDKLIGKRYAKTWGDDASCRTVLFGGAYLDPKYRGKGGSEPLYQVALDWALAKGYTKGVAIVRVGNKRAEGFMKKIGATICGTMKDRKYANGSFAPANIYQWNLPAKKLTNG